MVRPGKKTTQQLKTGAVNPDDMRIFPRRFTTLCPQSGQGMAESRMSNRFLLTLHTKAEAGLVIECAVSCAITEFYINVLV